MIPEIQEALKEILYRDAALPREVLDIRFAVPSNNWVAGLTTPTLNFFLYDIKENTLLRSMEFTQTYVPGGVRRTLAPRRIDLHFVGTVFFKSQLEEPGRDEWNVLWRVMAALMRFHEWKPADTPRVAQELGVPVLGKLGENNATASVFSSLGLSIRPHLHYIITAPLDLQIETFSPLVLQRDVRFQQGLEGEGMALHQVARSAWQVRDQVGRPLADALVKTDSGARGFTNAEGIVQLKVGRDQVGSLEVLTLDGERLHIPAGSPGAQLIMGHSEEDWDTGTWGFDEDIDQRN